MDLSWFPCSLCFVDVIEATSNDENGTNRLRDGSVCGGTSLALSALPAVFGGELHGTILLVHMGASGALVILLPMLTLLYFATAIGDDQTMSMFRWGYWLTVLSGFVTVATVFYCMLPILSTSQMREVMFFHGVGGFALVIAVVWLFLVVWKTRKVDGIPVRR